MKKIIPAFLFLVSLFAFLAFAPADAWKIGTKNNVTFSTSGVSGIFKTLTGKIVFDEQNLSTAIFDISIDVNSINTGNGMMNTHAKGDDWFESAKYPSIKFTSKKVEKTPTGYLATGSLQMHGITKDMSLPFTFTKNETGGIFEGTFSVKRNDFKIGEAGGEVGDEIKIKVTLPVTK